MAQTGVRSFIALVVAAVAVLVLANASALAQTPSVGATAEVRDASNRVVATAEFREGRGEVLITLLFPNPPVLSGTHAVHINDVGRCDPPAFTTAGNIFNPFNKKHGRQNPEGSEVGDLPNINFSNGLTSYNTTAPGGTLSSGQGTFLGPNRTSLVILSGEDDQLTAPEGNAGSRVACGVINPAAGAPVVGQPVVGAQPTPTPLMAPAVPKIASPVPAQPVAGQPAAGQPAAGQPAVKPANSPVVVPPPVVVKPATSPVAAAPAAQAIPTPIVGAPTAGPLTAASSTPSGGSNSLTALIIAVLGVGVFATGFLLWRRGQLTR